MTLTHPGGAQEHIFGSDQTDYVHYLDRARRTFPARSTMKQAFSALPHLGFFYQFGSKGLQQLHLDYQQQWGKRTAFNLLLEQDKLGEMMRHGRFNQQQFQWNIYHHREQFRALLEFSMRQSEVGYNFGLNDSLSANDFALSILRVGNTEAQVKRRQFLVQGSYEWDWLKDSLTAFGWTQQMNWQNQHREYRDSLNMTSKYSLFYLDSNRTRDQYQLASASAMSGLFWRKKGLSTELLYGMKYWDYQNLGKHLDTVETAVHWNLRWDQGAWRFRNQASAHLSGAIGSWMSVGNLEYRQKSWRAMLHYRFQEALPDPYWRRYYANSSRWKLDQLSTEGQRELGAKITGVGTWKSQLGVVYKQWLNPYLFVVDRWRNDSLTSLNALQLQVRTTIPLRAFGLHLYGALNPVKEDIVPQYDFRARLFFRKKLFKAQKFDWVIALETRYQDRFQLWSIDPVLDLNRLDVPGAVMKKAVVELNVMTAFQIDEFRFFVALENVDYFWNDADRIDLMNYPVTPNVLRLGLSWDFFN